MPHPHTTLARFLRLLRDTLPRRMGVLVPAVLLLATAARADSTFVGAGQVSGRWALDGSPYVLHGLIEIAAGDTLRISPGVRVFFAGPATIRVFGAVLALGAERDSIVFTADSVIDSVSWNGLRLSGAESYLRLEYCILENARTLGANDYGLGGAVFCELGTVEISHSVIRYCRALSGSGIFARNEAVLHISETVIRENGNASGCGGAVCLRDGSQLTMTGCEVSFNSSLYGGGFCVDASTAVIESTDISKNIASVWGGGLFCSQATVSLRNSRLFGNGSVGGGGIDGRWEVWLTMERCLIQENVSVRPGAQGPGGGLMLQGGEQTISNCTFVGNAASLGGAIYGGSSMTLENSIIAGQSAGHGLYFTAPGADVRYCCLYGNEGGEFGGTNLPAYFGQVLRTNANGDSCDNYWNIFLDPEFDDSAEVRYSLSAGSPCIDAGDPHSPPDPDGTVTDMGVYPFDQSSAVPGTPAALPQRLTLFPAYPNPFNPSTSLSFDLPQSGPVSLRVFDLLGREVARLADEPMTAGHHRLMWNASDQGTGTYFAVLESSGSRSVQKLLLLK